MTFNIILIVICSYILIAIFFYEEIKRFLKDKEDKKIKLQIEISRKGIDIDVK